VNNNRGAYIQGYNLAIYRIKQNRHIQNSAGYIDGRSILTVEPEILVDLYAGKGNPFINEGAWNNKERFTHIDIIGIWKAPDGKTSLATKNGMLHYSPQKGVHIVPAHPNNHSI